MRSWIFLFLCNLMWALQFTCIKLVQDQVGPLFTVWGPMTVATILLYPFIRMEKAETHAQASVWKQTWPYILLVVLGVFPAQMCMTWGTRISLASNAAILNLTTPIVTAFFAFLFLHERMSPVRWISFALAILGVLLCSLSDLHGLNFGSAYLAGNALIFLATAGSAFYNSYGKKVLDFHSPMRMLFFTYVGMFILMSPFVLYQEGSVFAQMPGFTAKTWIGLALLTIFHNYLSMVLFLTALKELDAIQAALSFYLVTFFGLPIAAISLHEKLSPAAVFGGIVVLGSTLLITLWESRRAASAKADLPVS